MNFVSDLSFIEYMTDNIEGEDLIRDKLFTFWYTEWHKTFTDLSCKEKANSLSSDDFINKRVLSLWCKDEPIAMLFLDVFRVDYFFNYYRRYLKNLPHGLLSLLKDKGFENTYSVNGLVIAKEWRKNKTDIPVSQILVSMGYAFAKFEKADVMLCYARNERNMNKVVEEHNSIKFGTYLRHNVDVDFMYTPMKSAIVFPNVVIEECCLEMLSVRNQELMNLKMSISSIAQAIMPSELLSLQSG